MGQIASFYFNAQEHNELRLKTDSLQQQITALESQQAELKKELEYQINHAQLMQKMSVDRQIVFEKSNNSQLKYIKKSLSEVADTFENFFQEYDLQLRLQDKKLQDMSLNLLHKLGYNEGESQLLEDSTCFTNSKRNLEQDSFEEQLTSDSPKIKKIKNEEYHPLIDSHEMSYGKNEIVFSEDDNDQSEENTIYP